MAEIISEDDIAAAPTGTTAPMEVSEADIAPDENVEPSYKGFFSGMSDRLSERGSNIYDLTTSARPGDAVMRTLGQEAAVVGDTIAESVKRLYHWLPEKTQENIENSAKRVLLGSGMGPVLIKAIQGSKEAYNRLSSAFPDETKNLEAILNIASVLGGGRAAKSAGEAAEGVAGPLAKEGANIARDAKEIAARALESDTEKTINEAIKGTMTRAVKMTSRNKSDWKALDKSFSKANDAVKAIVDNQGILSYTDQGGNVIGSGLPQTMEQFSQAISQVKQHIFSQYDALASEAEREGMGVDVGRIVEKLDEIANDKVILKFKPEVAEYAQKRATDLLVGSPVLTPSEAQKSISMMNDGLNAYYANPGFEGSHKIWIDEMITRDMRSALDEAVSNTSKEYQGLKNLYGSLSSIEPEVAHRAVIFGRQNIKGIPDYIGTPISTVMAVKGIMTGNPVEIAAAAATWTAKKAMKSANDADRLVASMFQKVETAMGRKGPFDPKSRTFWAMSGRNKGVDRPLEAMGFEKSPAGFSPIVHPEWYEGMKPSSIAQKMGSTQEAMEKAEMLQEALNNPKWARALETTLEKELRKKRR